MGIYVDGDLVTTWTSSGTTSSFENVELGVTGETLELRGVQTNSEWLSLLEVRPINTILHRGKSKDYVEGGGEGVSVGIVFLRRSLKLLHL